MTEQLSLSLFFPPLELSLHFYVFVVKCETVLGTLDATPKVPQHTSLT